MSILKRVVAIALVCTVAWMSISTTSYLVAAPQDRNPKRGDDTRIDWKRAGELHKKRKDGGKLTDEETAYVERAMKFRSFSDEGKATSRDRIDQLPITEMSRNDQYQGEEGGLYGEGNNEPPEGHKFAAETELAKIEPLDAEGKPAADGKIVFVSISMSNATQEFSVFKRLADADSAKSSKLTIVDCAQGGQAMAQWVNPKGRPWKVADERLEKAEVSPKQIQIAWIKLANIRPTGDLKEHGEKLKADTVAVIQNAKKRFPNLRVIYLGSRIYAGYSTAALNPEPYAFESVFVVRWLIKDQINRSRPLNYDPLHGPVKAPILLWGPYLWADGITPRKADGLTWQRTDLAEDGVHPTKEGREKVAKLLLNFFKTDPLAKKWFTK